MSRLSHAVAALVVTALTSSGLATGVPGAAAEEPLLRYLVQPGGTMSHVFLVAAEPPSVITPRDTFALSGELMLRRDAVQAVDGQVRYTVVSVDLQNTSGSTLVSLPGATTDSLTCSSVTARCVPHIDVTSSSFSAHVVLRIGPSALTTGTDPLLVGEASAPSGFDWSASGPYIGGYGVYAPGQMLAAFLNFTLELAPQLFAAPTGVTTWPGDGEVLVAWNRPDPVDGQSPTSYRVYVQAQSLPGEQVLEVDAGSTSLLVSNLANGVAYTFQVAAVGSSGPGERSLSTAPVTPAAELVAPDAYTATTIGPAGGSATTGSAPTADDPVLTTVTVPAGSTGPLTITETDAVSTTAPARYSFFGQQVDIVAPSASATSPLELVFEVHSSRLPADVQISSITLVRTEGSETVTLADCASADKIADPDPCVWQRSLTPTGNLVLVALTSHASSWNTAVVKNRPVAAGCVRHDLDNRGCRKL